MQLVFSFFLGNKTYNHQYFLHFFLFQWKSCTMLSSDYTLLKLHRTRFLWGTILHKVHTVPLFTCKHCKIQIPVWIWWRELVCECVVQVSQAYIYIKVLIFYIKIYPFESVKTECFTLLPCPQCHYLAGIFFVFKRWATGLFAKTRLNLDCQWKSNRRLFLDNC